MVTETITMNGTSSFIPVKPRIICISGFAESTRDMANKVSKDIEIWSLNRCYTFLKRWDRWYEVHQPELYTGKTGLREPEYLDMLAKSKVPVYMQVVSPDVPNAVQFPIKEILAAGFRDYFTTSISYMLAHIAYEHKALGQTVGEVMMFGVDMSAFSEYSYQRPSVEYWLGVLEGIGIKITIPKLSPVLKGPSYGDHQYKYLWEQARDRIAHLKGKQSEIAANLQGVMGAAQEYQHIPKELPELTETFKNMETSDETALKVKASLVEIDKKIKNRVKELTQGHAQLNADLNATLGALRESQHWLTVVGAPQSHEQEPDGVKLPQI